MALTVPATAPVPLQELYNGITTLTTLIANATQALNGPLVLQLTKQKAQKQMALVLALLGGGYVLASNVLANETYAVPSQPGADQL